MNSQNRITIVSVCDNHYVILLATLIKSIEETHKTDEIIDFYIVEDRIHPKNKKRLISSSNPQLINFHWLTMSEALPENMVLPRDNSSYPLNIYVRLWIPHFIPVKVKKVLYLDVDMILMEDISKLWNTDIKDNIIGAVIDRPELEPSSWKRIGNYQNLGLSDDTKYFNSGLLLIDTDKWRDADITNKIIKCIKDNIEFADFPDQYGLNVVLANQWFELDNLWNCHASSEQAEPHLIHFSMRKPIYRTYNNNPVYKEIFDRYRNLTFWKNHKPVSELRRLFKKLYNKFEKKSKGAFD